MNKKWLPFVLILLIAAAIVLIKWVRGKETSSPKTKTTQTTKDPSSTVNRDRGFDRRISWLKYSNHAKCRMDCRKVSQGEVEEIMKEGKINYKKSDLQNTRCPRYAVEGITSDEQRVRIVYAQCNESTTVVTVIDLDTDFTCSCPGDDGRVSSTSKNKP